MTNAFYRTSKGEKKDSSEEATDMTTKKAGSRIMAISTLLCLMYAITDELHQIFVPGRVASIWDVLIDTMGAAFGVLLFMLIRKAG